MILTLDDAGNAKLASPRRERVTVDLTEEQWLAFADFETKFPPSSEPEGVVPVAVEVPIPQATEYFSVEAFASEWDVVASASCPGLKLNFSIAVPKGAGSSKKEHLCAWMENPSAKERVQLKKGDIVMKIGPGHFQEDQSADAGGFPYAALPFNHTGSHAGEVLEKDAVIAYAAPGTAGPSIMTVTDVLKA